MKPRLNRIGGLRRGLIGAFAGLAALLLLPASGGGATPSDDAMAPIIQFEKNSSQLGAHAQAQLAKVARLLRADPALQIEVLGFGNDTGNASVDQELSYQRARRVARAIAAHGVRITDIYATGVGQLKPVAAAAPGMTADPGRSVEIRIQGPQAAAKTAALFGSAR